MVDTAVLLDGLHFGEAPRHGPDGRFYFSDFYEKAVFTVDLETGEKQVVCSLPGQPSGLGWLPDGTLLVVSMLDRTVRRLESNGVLALHADLIDIASFHANDMLVDANGRAYVGNFGFDLHKTINDEGIAAVLEPDYESPSTSLALVEPDGTTSVAATDMKFPNGMVLLPDGTLVVAETTGFRLTAFDVAEDGTLSNRRVWADLRGQMIAPDGICVDAEGGVWVATALQPLLVRVVEGGTITDRVETSQLTYAVGLVGTTLIACTAPTSDPDVVGKQHVGRLETVRVKVGGR
ncbi:SMP-30/gluconolactonase/LRE family protein [Umezawaea sp. Da 62-37]|uniref:SMP-30/gluconolactonase/LRE family protein n=1 Tax=Umezawaea sp. Da 62-37 TaxID=3075927 RepID=UPI0028F7471E|nr:SMP-30/gluconolactonase/LRE family protein [Umezawaea sp. Da 62-37]WNV83618.1 SMP-30/gluconolactonase/LRE family protein [Umezawaea sp. Da 62-37]